MMKMSEKDYRDFIEHEEERVLKESRENDKRAEKILGKEQLERIKREARNSANIVRWNDLGPMLEKLGKFAKNLSKKFEKLEKKLNEER